MNTIHSPVTIITEDLYGLVGIEEHDSMSDCEIRRRIRELETMGWGVSEVQVGESQYTWISPPPTTMEVRKVFDSTKMPDDVRDAMVTYFDDWGLPNDVYIDWHFSYAEDEDKVKCINSWLLENGANSDETVLIKYWW